MPILPAWPAAMRQKGAAGVSGSPQLNVVSFQPDIGPDISRRRASSFTRTYKITFNLLNATEYAAFITFYHTTLQDGVLPFSWVHPITDEARRCRFATSGQGYTETRRKNNLFDLEFDLVVLEALSSPLNSGPDWSLMDLDYAWQTSLSGDPTTGHISANNATLASATVIRISKTGRNGELLGAYLATWGASTNAIKGHLRVVTVGDRTEFIEADITAISDQTTYYNLTVTVNSAAGSPDLNAPMAVSYSRTGDAGGALPSFTSADAGRGVRLNSSGSTYILGAVTLDANRTIYVRADGSDSNTGLVNNAGGAFLTLQKAWDTLITYFQNGFTVTVQVADGTYTGPLYMLSPPSGLVTIQGNTTTPSNVFINCGAVTACFYGGFRGPVVTIKGFKLGTSSFGDGIYADYGCNLVWDRIDLGTITHHCFRTQGGKLQNTGGGAFTLSGSVTTLFYAAFGGVIQSGSMAVTLTGTPNFATACALAESYGFISVYPLTFSGSATGVRYSATDNALIKTYGSGANYFPGNSAGSVSTQGQYL